MKRSTVILWYESTSLSPQKLLVTFTGLNYCLRSLGLNSFSVFIFYVSQGAYPSLDTFILASQKFQTGFLGELVFLTKLTWVSLHYNIYKNLTKLASFKISYLK